MKPSPSLRLDQRAIERLCQRRIVEPDREIFPALLAAFLPRGAKLDIAGLWSD
jgi:hypothetical protein